MGFYIRKSFGFGPIRFNLSKSGIGVSAGIKGARIGTGPRGAYVHAGRKGIYYRQSIGSHAKPKDWDNKGGPVGTVTKTGSSKLETGSVELVNEINERVAHKGSGKTFLIGTVLLAILFPLLTVLISVEVVRILSVDAAFVPLAGVLAFLVALVAGGYVTKKVYADDEVKRTTPLYYELEPDVSKRFERVKRAMKTLSHCKKLRFQTFSSTTNDRKRNAGANELVSLQPARVAVEAPPNVSTNVEVWAILLGDLRLYFLPDQILALENGVFGRIPYDEFDVDLDLVRFLEEGDLPGDCEVLDSAWKYQNSDGGPDKRFSENYKIPIVKYAELRLWSKSGFEIVLQASNVAYAEYFWRVFDKDKDFVIDFRERRASDSSATSENPSPEVSDYETIGVSSAASNEEILKAYRNIIKQYHPDRVAHMAPEFIELAEERVKEINRAFQSIKESRRF